jgi:hypothetical protein
VERCLADVADQSWCRSWGSASLAHVVQQFVSDKEVCGICVGGVRVVITMF